MPDKQETTGPWARLFRAEPAYVYAQILDFAPEISALEFEASLAQDPAAALQMSIDLARRLRDWIARLPRDAASPFVHPLEQLNAEADFEVLLSRMASATPSRLLRILRSFHPTPASARAAGALAEARAFAKSAASNHALLRNAVGSLQLRARTAFDARIVSGQMDPAIGLLVAELRTAESIDAQVNDIVDRYIRFYYEQIVGQRPRGASGERVLLDLAASPKRVFVPAGTRVEARAEDKTIQVFETEGPAHLSPAAVGKAFTLSYATDPQISFNATLGGITSVSAKEHVFDQDGAVQRTAQGIFTQPANQPADMGLDIESQMFSLAEGTRWIEVSLCMRRPSGLPAASVAVTSAEARQIKSDPRLTMALRSDPELVNTFLPGQLEHGIGVISDLVEQRARDTCKTISMALVYEVLADGAWTVDALRMIMGRIATLCLIERQPFPSGAYWDRLFAKIDACRDALSGQYRDPATQRTHRRTLIFEAFSDRPDGTIAFTPEDVFERLLGESLTARLTTAEGLRPATTMQVLPFQGDGEGGLTIRMRIDANEAAIVAEKGAHAPRLSLRRNDAARICPVSFLERYTLENVQIQVRVEGLKKLVAFSDDGPIATAQTFAPFGPRPADGSTFIVGAPELALKPITRIGLGLVWGEMPDAEGGFEAHYRDYAGQVVVPEPKLAFDYLSGDGWKAIDQPAQDLFRTDPINGTLLKQWHMDARVTGYAAPASGRIAEQEFASRQTIRAGVLRMTIDGTGGGFLAQQYPLALADAMRPRYLSMKSPKIPPAPFVPRIDSLALNYSARSTIDIAAPMAAQFGDRIVQVGPFGQSEVYPRRLSRDIQMFPHRLGYGHLFLQITGAGAKLPVALLFEMADNGHLRVVHKRNPIRWFYLTANGWAPLPDTAISSDTTSGLTRSGLVMLDLPEDAETRSGEMPDGGVWIVAVAMEPRLQTFPSLRRISTNGVWAVRRDGQPDDKAYSTPTGRDWTFDPPVAGSGAISEIETPARVQPPEDRNAYLARVSERLRHRRRAVTPWDVERIVLQDFPDVWMAKCLPHLTRKSNVPDPGRATLVVVRRPDHATRFVPGDRHSLQACTFDAGYLNTIGDHIRSLGPSTANVDVVNPTFEHLQVRAKVAFEEYRDDGAMAQRLKEDLGRYLSVWTAPAGLARFGWSLNLEMLGAHINALSYVRMITEFSVLHLAADDHRQHVLLDTAQTDGRGPHGPVIRNALPWGLPLSAPDHALVVLNAPKKEDAIQSGIGRLPVGEMLIVGQRNAS